MYNIVFRDQRYQCRTDETLLQAFQRQGVELPFSCQKGSCHVCMLHCVEGEVDDKSQLGLRSSYAEKGYFLPCQCRPRGDLVVREIPRNELYHSACVYRKEYLSENICRLLIDCDRMQDYLPGQFINLCRPADGLVRSYSLASVPDRDYYLELHVKRMKNGAMSNWIFDELQEQDIIEIQGPMGDCYYRGEDRSRPMLLVAGGTGLAPLMGVLEQAISSGHEAPVHVYHEVSNLDELYLNDALRNLEHECGNVSYFPCIKTASISPDVTPGTALNRIRHRYADLSAWDVYTAGSPFLVREACALAAQLGSAHERIFSDPFDMKDLRVNARTPISGGQVSAANDGADDVMEYKEVDYPQPDPELWAALDGGKKLYRILEDFYAIVYEDDRLSPFFENITRQRSIEKVYLFLKQIFSGEKVYFGDRPRNAHHWMVISDELFDHRENIMESCLRRHGLPEHLIRRWRAVEESFRPDIVKDAPWNRVMNGVEIQLEGYEEIQLDCGSLCDSCQQPIEAGTRVRYHLRLGNIYCPSCMQVERTGSKG